MTAYVRQAHIYKEQTLSVQLQWQWKKMQIKIEVYEGEDDVDICIRIRSHFQLVFFSCDVSTSIPFFTILFAHELQKCLNTLYFSFFLPLSAYFICQQLVLSIFLHHHCPIIYYYDTNVYKLFTFISIVVFYHLLFLFISFPLFAAHILFGVRIIIIYYFTCPIRLGWPLWKRK